MSIERSAFPPCEYFPALGACEWWPSVAVVVDCFGALESVAAWASTWTAARVLHHELLDTACEMPFLETLGRALDSS
jgi:hypothetical protein